MKMYIGIPEDVQAGIAINSAAHASLMAHLKWSEDFQYSDWLKNSFKKVTCKVTPAEFEMLRQIPDSIVVTESRLKGREVAVVIKPQHFDPLTERWISVLKLWTGD